VLLQGGKFIKLAGCQFRNVGRCSSVSQPNIVPSVESAVPCTVGHFYGGETHCCWKGFVSCSAHKQSCNSPDLEARPVFQVGHNVEVPRLCSFHACAATNTTVKLEPSVTHSSSIWKLNVLCLSNNMTGKFLSLLVYYFGTQVKWQQQQQQYNHV